MRQRFPGIALLLLLSLSLSAQTVRDSVTIEVVDVPVFVARGNDPVEGLGRDDFELFVNGKRQPIEYFDAVTPGASAESLRERRLWLLMIDVSFTSPHGVSKARRAAAELVARAPESDLFAIATVSSRRGVWFTTPFTSDRTALARAISSLSSSASKDPLGVVMTASERMSYAEWTDITAEQSDFFVNGVSRGLVGEALRDAWSTPVRRIVEEQLQDFRDLAARIAAIQGQKHVVLLSEGYEVSDGGSLADVRRVSYDTGPRRLEPGVNLLTAPVLRYLEQMRESFQAADILMHTLDIRGVHSMMDSHALFVLANETGGSFVHTRNDLGAGLVDLAERYSHGYVLGFRPVDAKRGNNKIEVKLKNAARNTTVHHRKGFSGSPLPFDVDEGLYLADVVLNDVPQTGTAAGLELGKGTLKVRVPMRPLAAQLGSRGTAQLMVYLFDHEGTAIDFHRHVIDVPADATGETTFDIAVPEHTGVAKALLVVNDSLGFSRTGPG